MKTLKQISLKNHPKYNEAWLQQTIAEDPSILGLGKLEVHAREKRQPAGGRLDMILVDTDTDTDTSKRYEVELQLGATDESHIIRTIEYWDVERKRYPSYSHTAVLIAEDVTSRFLNVIHLFNGHIPLILLKLTAYEIDGDVALTFTKILDEVQLGIPEDETPPEPADRNYWESKKSCKAMLDLTDKLFDIVKLVDDSVNLNYTKAYIGLAHDKIANNFCEFYPGKKTVALNLKRELPQEDIRTLEEAGLEVIKRSSTNEHVIKFSSVPNKSQFDLVKGFIEQSKKNRS